MDQALLQAALGAGLASPNPTVGCVIVKNGELLGKGFHSYDDLDHAEVVALRNAGSSARGATAYVTLEPCSHRGRTGPCANALIAAGIVRVVVAATDPNPVVNGRGIRHLQAAGVRVTTGIRRVKAQRLNDAFACMIHSGLPLVTMKAGLTLDGRIAPSVGARTAGEPYWISSAESRAAVHRMRHASDALLLGINSVLLDDPLLTDRSELPRRRPLMRAIVDSHLRIPLDSRLVCSAAEDLIVFCTGISEARRPRVKTLEDRGVQVVELGAESPQDERVSLKEVLQWFAGQQFTSVMLEGGSTLTAQALRQDRVDKACLFYAPNFFGAEGVPLIGNLLGAKIHLQHMDVSRSGEDILVQALIHDPWAETA